MIGQIQNIINKRMDDLVGSSDYRTGIIDNRIVVSFRFGDLEFSNKMANEVINYVNNHFGKNILKVYNFSNTMFWLTLEL